MPPLNPTSVRVIDPILTTHVQGYQHPGRVGHLLFPRVPVYVSGGQILEFGKESFRKYATRRAPGGATRRITFGYLGKPFALVQDSLEAPVPREFMRDASRVPGIDLGRMATDTTMQVITLALESEQAAVAVAAANYDNDHKLALAAGTKWSADTGVPLTDIDTGREAIRASIGMEPNTLILSAVAWKAARNNPQVAARIYAEQPDTDRGPVTLEQFRRAVDLPTVAVAGAIAADENDAFEDIWGNNAVLAYVAPQGQAAVPVPSYGYTYTMDGHPLVEQPYWDNNAKSWIYGVTMERAPVLTGMAAGFLLQSPN